MHDLLIVKTRALYDTEQQLTKALPKLAEAASDPQLKQAFNDHLKETEGHVSKLEEVFKLLDVAPRTEISESVRGLAEDAQWCIDNIQAGPTRDAALIASAQYAEHQEMAGYGSAAEFAKVLGLTDVKNIFGTILDEEKAADEKLNMLATSHINEDAASPQGAEERKGFFGRLQTGDL